MKTLFVLFLAAPNKVEAQKTTTPGPEKSGTLPKTGTFAIKPQFDQANDFSEDLLWLWLRENLATLIQMASG
jgi:hypothetical protein